MTSLKNNKSLSEKCDSDYIPEKKINHNLVDDTVDLNETPNPNLDSDADDLDDIRTSISEKTVNPLYIENQPSADKIVLPPANLVEDDRFWQEQVNQLDEMDNDVRGAQDEGEALQEEMRDPQIVTLCSSSSSSPDSFTPFKTIKDRCPDVITKWSISLLHGNLLIIGHDKEGKEITRVCNRRVSSYIFHDPNGIVCSLLGPCDPDSSSNVPKYILDKFKMGIPEDWSIITQYWRHYKSLNCPVKYTWPALPRSSSYNQTINWYEIPDTDTSFAESGRMSSTAQKLAKKITKMQKMLRATLLKESFSSAKTLSATLNSNREKSIKNDSLSNRQIPNDTDSILLRKVAANNNLSNVNSVEGSNVNTSAIKVENEPPNADTLFSGKSNFEIVSFHNRTSSKPVEISSDSEESESEHAHTVSSSESSLHLEPLVSEDSHSTNQKKLQHIETKKMNSGSDIFSSIENKKLANKKIDTLKAVERTTNTSGGSSSFVSLNYSDLSKVSSNKEATAGLNSSNKKVSNSTGYLKNHHSNPDISVSSRGRIRVSTIPFWQGSRLVSEKDGIKIISSSNSNVSNVFRKPPDIDTLKILGRKKICKEFEIGKSQSENLQGKSIPGSSPKTIANIVPNKINSEVFMKSPNVDTIKTRSRKKASDKSESELSVKEELLKTPESETTKKRGVKQGWNKAETESSQLKSSPEKTTIIVTSTPNPDELLKSPNSETVKKRARIKSETERYQSESSPKRSTKNVPSNAVNPETPIKKGGRKKAWTKTETENSQSTSAFEKSTKVILNTTDPDFLKPPDIDTINKKRGQKKSSGKTSQTSRSDSVDPYDVSSSQMSGQSVEEVKMISQTSRELSQLSDTSNCSMNSSVSSRGRRRVPTLPFWAGHRLKVNKEEIIIQKSLTVSCHIDSYVNDDTITSDKTNSNRKRDDSPVQSYQEVFDKTAFKNPRLNCKTAALLTSTLRESFNNETIINYNNASTSRINSPFRKQINNVVNNTRNTTKNIVNKPLSISPIKVTNKSNLEVAEITEIRTNTNISKEKNCTPIRNKITAEQSPRKNTPKQLKELKSTGNETNEISTTNYSPFRCRTRSASKQQNGEDSKQFLLENELRVNLSRHATDYLNENKIYLSPKESQIRRGSRSPTKKQNDVESPNYKQSSHPKLLKNHEKNLIIENKETSVSKRTRSASKTQNDDETPGDKQSSHSKQLKNHLIENRGDTTPKPSPIVKRSKSASKSQYNEESPDNKQSSHQKLLNNHPKNLIIENKESSVSKRTRSASKTPNVEETPDDKQSSHSKQLKNPQKNHLIENRGDSSPKPPPIAKRSKYASKTQNNEELPDNKRASQTKQLKHPPKNQIVENEAQLVTKETQFRKRTRSASKKLFEDNPEDNTKLKIKSNEAVEISKKQLLQVKSTVIKTKSNTRKNLKYDSNSSYNPYAKIYKSSTVLDEFGSTSKRRSGRRLSKINSNEKTDDSFQLRLTSRYNTRSLITRPYKYTAQNNFNFTVETISHIEENIPNKKRTNNKTKKETKAMSPKQTTVFKVAKKRKNKQILLSDDPNELYLLINKNKKSKKKEPESIVKAQSQDRIKKTADTVPKKRKLFVNNDWMQSAEYTEQLSQTNPDEGYSSSKFVLTIDPVLRSQEFDVMSEVSGLF